MANRPETGTPHPIKHNLLLSLSATKQTMIFFLICVLSASVGCTTTPKPASLLVLQVSEVEEALRRIEASYRQKDAARLLSYLDTEFKQADRFKAQIHQDFTAFSEINMTMKVIRVNKTNAGILTAIHWEKTLTERADNPRRLTLPSPLHQSGHALFVWSLDALPRLLDVRGDAPWGGE